MIHEIYTRIPTDLNFTRQVETTDEIEQILAQIRMILGTTPGQILGSIHFGVNLKQYIFQLDYNQEEMRKIIVNTINQEIVYDREKWQIDTELKFGKDHDNGADYAVLDIIINQRKCLGIIITQN